MTSAPFSYQQTPSPSTPLNGHCSVIFNTNGVDTLFAFQSNAFQSLPLQPGASWATLAPGVAVNGAKCVLGKWNNQDALIVVGGTTTDPAQKDFPGLQYYTFATNQWASIPPGNSVVQNRLMHGAAYLESSNTLLVYSGFQDNSFTQSSETFTIAAVPPYTSKSMPAGAPLAINPIVLPWNASHAAMLGGSDSNRAVWIFNQDMGWGKLGVSVPSIVTNMSTVTAATMNLDNDGKVLELFDLQAVPNTVTSLTVQSSNSNPQARDIVIRDDIPPYNGTLSSSVERVGYSLAQTPSSGLVIASGGTGDAAAAVVMFNQTSNAWISPQAFFEKSNGNNQFQSPLGSSSSTSSSVSSSASTDAASTSTTSISTSASSAAASTTLSTSSTSSGAINLGTALPTSTSAPDTGGGGLSQTNRTILGGVLGGLAGVGALLVLLLLILRWRKQKKRARSPDYHDEGKNQMGFDDSDAVADYPRSASRGTKNSGKEEWKKMPTAQEKLGAPISKPNLISDSLNPAGIGLSSQTQPLISTTGPSPEAKSDDGWNQYFAKAGSSNALIPEEDRLRMDSVSHQTEYTSSNYDVASHTASIYQDQDSALLDPRGSGYPKSEQSWEQSKLHPSHKRGPSSEYRPESSISEEDETPETFLDPASSTSGTQAWESLGPGNGQSAFDLRPSSSVYAESIQYPHPGDKVHIAGEDQSFNSSGATKGTSTNTNNSWKTPSESRGMRTLATKDLTGALSSRPQKDDMSWLNLGKQ